MILRYPKLPKNINDTKDLPLAILMEGNLHQKNSFSSKGISTDMFIAKLFYRSRSFKEGRILPETFPEKYYQ